MGDRQMLAISLLVVPSFKESSAEASAGPVSAAADMAIPWVSGDVNLYLLPATRRKHGLDPDVCLSLPSVAVMKL